MGILETEPDNGADSPDVALMSLLKVGSEKIERWDPRLFTAVCRKR